MSRRNKETPLPFWATANANNKSIRYIQSCHSLRINKSFQSLKYSTRYVYECMMDEAKGNREFEFPRHVAKQYGLNGTILNHAVKELEAAGFITTDSGRTTRTANKYSFSMKWKQLQDDSKLQIKTDNRKVKSRRNE